MSRGINKVILVGNVGNEPDTKYTQSGTAVTKISLATSSMRKDREGNSREFTEWHRVVFFGKLGEISGEYLRKGSQVYVEGELRYGKYTDDAGVERYTTDIIANQMQMLGGRGDGGSDGQQRVQAPRRQGGSGSTVDRQRQAAGNTAPPMDDFADDDLPPF